MAAIKLLHAADAQESPRDSSFETGKVLDSDVVCSSSAETVCLHTFSGRVLRRIAAGLGVPRWNWNLTAGPCDSKRDEMNCVRYDCSFSNGTACLPCHRDVRIRSLLVTSSRSFGLFFMSSVSLRNVFFGSLSQQNRDTR